MLELRGMIIRRKLNKHLAEGSLREGKQPEIVGTF